MAQFYKLCAKDPVLLVRGWIARKALLSIWFNARTGNIYSMAKHTKTLKVRVKDKHIPLLNNMARSVNFVWYFVVLT